LVAQRDRDRLILTDGDDRLAAGAVPHDPAQVPSLSSSSETLTS
jgi:hypothetical protein